MDDAVVAAHLQSLEERLLEPAVRTDPRTLEALLAPDFIEIGSSGRVFDRPAILALLLAETQTPAPGVHDFTCTLLASTVALVTYRIVRPGGLSSLRSSVWVKSEAAWQMRFHQGTRLASPA